MEAEGQPQLPHIQPTPVPSKKSRPQVVVPGTPKGAEVGKPQTSDSKKKERRYELAYDKAYLLGKDQKSSNQPGLKIKLYESMGKKCIFTVKEFIEKIKTDIIVANKCLDAYESNYKQAEEEVKEDEDRVNVAAQVLEAKAKGLERVSALPEHPKIDKYSNDIIIKFHLELYGVTWKYFCD